MPKRRQTVGDREKRQERVGGIDRRGHTTPHHRQTRNIGYALLAHSAHNNSVERVNKRFEKVKKNALQVRS